ncbi:hypothetical protein KRR38_24770 [Novosphingobium sp. G106]|uniref:hypothetical protein n=1 Tax=Novosphingobium sp. G106 TaxID=2849500 RepID=UPI001C2DBE09|nr:hypothetical protein [Novosphingobium sp. G106]MBV1690801.1 hypothetical protein [Novosphingobium sp. G106]
MPLRQKFVIACLAASALTPLPALARDSEATSEPSSEAANVAKRLSDPANQVAATVALTALSEALLDIKIEPLRKALSAAGSDAARDLPPDARLRDLAGPEARELPGTIGKRVPQAMSAAAGMAGAVQDMLPELKAAADKLKHAIPDQYGQ